tara:strand:+ start:231 stop:698 length:468 start_codon:yes stop_codon:yes gene_type:complete
MADSIVKDLAEKVKVSLATVESTIASNFNQQSALTSEEFDALADIHDAAHIGFTQALGDEHDRRKAAIEALQASGSAQMSAIIGDTNDGRGLNTIFGAYELFVSNEKNVSASLQAVYEAESASIQAYREELGIDEENDILNDLNSGLSLGLPTFV